MRLTGHPHQGPDDHSSLGLHVLRDDDVDRETETEKTETETETEAETETETRDSSFNNATPDKSSENQFKIKIRMRSDQDMLHNTEYILYMSGLRGGCMEAARRFFHAAPRYKHLPSRCDTLKF